MSKNKKALIVIFAVLIVLSIIIISTVIIVKRQNDLKARIAFEDRCGIELPSNARIKQFYKDKDRFLAFDIDLNLEARTQLEEAINNTYPPGEWRRELTKDDVPYICIEKVLTDIEAETWPNNDYYEWSYDRRFFYKYADTSLGPLYRNLNKDSLEVLILEQNNGWQYLLARTDSPLASAETMRIEDFGMVVIEDILFGRAKDFEMLFYANTKGIDEQTVFWSDEPEDILEENGWFYGLNLTYECTRIPGLRYSFRAVPSDDNMKTYVNSRAENGRVMIYGPTILPMDELNEAWEAVALCQD